MTRARKAAKGLVTPPPLDRWIDAVLMLFVSLVQGVAATLGMIFNRKDRDWHTASAHEELPQAKSDIQLTKDTTSHPVILGPDPRILLGTPRGLFDSPLEQDSRLKAENDTVVAAQAAPTSSPPPNGGGAARTPASTKGFRWGIALATRTVRTSRTTVPHLTCARCTHLACSSSPVRGRTTPSHA